MPTGALAALAALLALAGTAAAAGECRFDEHTAYQQLAAGDTWELQMPVTSAGECCGAVAAREAWARGEQAARDLGLAGSFRDTPVPFRIKPSVFHSQSSLTVSQDHQNHIVNFRYSHTTEMSPNDCSVSHSRPLATVAAIMISPVVTALFALVKKRRQWHQWRIACLNPRPRACHGHHQAMVHHDERIH